LPFVAFKSPAGITTRFESNGTDMSRASRLLELLQLLRQYRYPVKGNQLASKLGISVRTLYRDIKTLQGQGAVIDGEAGVGYLLRPGYILPPLMFSEEEIEAFVLGMRWVAKRGDRVLSHAAHNALAKVSAVLPADLRGQLETSSLLIGPSEVISSIIDLPLIRQSIRSQCKVHISYTDLKDVESTRIIWPFALAYFDHVRVIVAWCEVRQAFRHFRLDRIAVFSPTGVRYPKNRQVLLNEWRKIEGISSSQT